VTLFWLTARLARAFTRPWDERRARQLDQLADALATRPALADAVVQLREAAQRRRDRHRAPLVVTTRAERRVARREAQESLATWCAAVTAALVTLVRSVVVTFPQVGIALRQLITGTRKDVAQ